MIRLISFADAAKEQLISANVVGESLSFLKTCNDKITIAIMNALCELIKDGNLILFHTFVCLLFLKTFHGNFVNFMRNGSSCNSYCVLIAKTSGFKSSESNKMLLFCQLMWVLYSSFL